MIPNLSIKYKVDGSFNLSIATESMYDEFKHI